MLLSGYAGTLSARGSGSPSSPSESYGNGAEVRSWGEANRSRLGAWIAARPVLPYDAEIARTWARMSAGAQLRGRPRPQNDTWIAACCVRHGVPLVTLNTKDFAPFVEHDGLVLLTEVS